jgi:NADH-quinone oxidoreductase subunit G
VYRLLPRRNPAVNKSWMCDAGRMAYKQLNAEDRLTAAMRRVIGVMAPATLSAALGDVADAIAAARAREKTIAMIASPRATNETLFAFRTFARVVGTPHLDYRADGSHALTQEREDAILRRRDPHPNNSGAAAIIGEPNGGGMTVPQMLEAAKKGQIAVLYLLGPELLSGHTDRHAVRDALAQIPTVVVHAETWSDELQWATVIFPAASYAEQDGTFTNHAGRVQRIQRAFAPSGDAKPAGAIVRELTRRAGGTPPPETAIATFKQLTESVDLFRGMKWSDLAPHGAQGGVGIPAYASAEGWL